jgi:hypothetical protein
MAQQDPQEQKFTTPGSLAVDAVLSLGCFVFLYGVVSPHVPSNDKAMIVLWSALTAACMTGVFGLCIQMVRVVLRAQREAKRGR